ncbi:MAG: hypothetical protein PWQ79_1396 [Thermococcaceae archaeon]|nr:hypothetical protein [Thermococcaceae archaeon]MDK2914481.1 hypothetical protein [Thermococcaceae archaeon]
MRKLLFALLFLALLAGVTYLRGGNSVPSPPTERETVIEVTGLVENSYNMTLEELKALPSVNVSAPLYCVDNPKVPRKNGTWKGVPLKTLLEKAKPKSGAFKVAFHASDGYTTDLHLLTAMNDESIIIAYEFNGEPISPRLVVPGRWGYKWIKYLTKIELVSYNFLGTWESAGYPDDAYIDEIEGAS